MKLSKHDIKILGRKIVREDLKNLINMKFGKNDEVIFKEYRSKKYILNDVFEIDTYVILWFHRDEKVIKEGTKLFRIIDMKDYIEKENLDPKIFSDILTDYHYFTVFDLKRSQIFSYNTTNDKRIIHGKLLGLILGIESTNIQIIDHIDFSKFLDEVDTTMALVEMTDLRQTKFFQDEDTFANLTSNEIGETSPVKISFKLEWEKPKLENKVLRTNSPKKLLMNARESGHKITLLGTNQKGEQMSYKNELLFEFIDLGGKINNMDGEEIYNYLKSNIRKLGND